MNLRRQTDALFLGTLIIWIIFDVLKISPFPTYGAMHWIPELLLFFTGGRLLYKEARRFKILIAFIWLYPIALASVMSGITLSSALTSLSASLIFSSAFIIGKKYEISKLSKDNATSRR